MKNPIILIFLFLTLSGCTSKAERAFIGFCKSSGIKSSLCSCTYEKIESHYGKEVIARMDEGGALPRDLQSVTESASVQCLLEESN